MSKQQRALTWRSALLTSTAVAFAAGMGATAVAKEGARVIHSAKDQVKLRVSGQINRAVVFADDGFQTQTRHVDVDFSSSRFRWQADAKVNNDIKIGGVIEVQVEPNSNFGNRGGGDQDTESGTESNTNSRLSPRKVEFWIHHNQFGRVYVGKGDPGSNGSNNTTAHAGGVAMLNSSTALVYGGLEFKTARGSGATSATVNQVNSDLDGLTRANRIRYDTPVFAGFQGRVSHLDAGSYDLTLLYNGKILDSKVKAALAYSDSSGQSLAGRDGELINGALSFVHSSGFGLTGAFGIQSRDDQEQDQTASGINTNGSSQDPTMYYLSAHFQRKFTELGTTFIGFAYQENSEQNQARDTARAYQVSVLQHIDAAAFELYATYAHYELDRSAANGVDTSFKDLDVVLVGGRLKF
jgi:hypothetical protein